MSLIAGMPSFFRSYVKPKGSYVLVLDAIDLLSVLVRDAPEEERAHFPLVRSRMWCITFWSDGNLWSLMKSNLAFAYCLSCSRLT